MTRAEKIARRREQVEKVEKEAQEWVNYHLACCNHISTLTEFALAMMEKQREEDIETAMDHQCRAWHELCDCRGDIAAAIRAENNIASLVGTPPIICEGCGGEINPDYGKCIRCS